MGNSYKYAIIIMFVILISGCASQQYRQKPTTLVPETGQARISLARKMQFLGGGAPITILEDSLPIASLRSGGNCTWDRSPGEMILSVVPWGSYSSNPLTVNVLPGFHYRIILWTEGGWSIFHGAQKIVLAVEGTDKITDENNNAVNKTADDGGGTKEKEAVKLITEPPK